MKIYVASSCRNNMQPLVVAALRNAGHGVFDFKNPAHGFGFCWADIDFKWMDWSPSEFAEKLNHPLAVTAFKRDMEALALCDACVLVMPCGRSAHLELGYAVGTGKKTIILLSDGEPELMYRMVNGLATSIPGLLKMLRPERV